MKLTIDALPGAGYEELKRRALELAEKDVRMHTLLELAATYGYPESFVCDLYDIDRTTLQNEPELNDFLFVLRKYGTHLWELGLGKYEYGEAIIDGNPDAHYFHVFGDGTYHVLAPSVAKELLVNGELSA